MNSEPYDEVIEILCESCGRKTYNEYGGLCEDCYADKQLQNIADTVRELCNIFNEGSREYEHATEALIKVHFIVQLRSNSRKEDRP